MDEEFRLFVAVAVRPVVAAAPGEWKDEQANRKSWPAILVARHFHRALLSANGEGD